MQAVFCVWRKDGLSSRREIRKEETAKCAKVAKRGEDKEQNEKELFICVRLTC